MQETGMTEELRDWAEGSHFNDADGTPRRWFHGTDIEDSFNIFAYFDEASLGFHFGSVSAANDRLAQIFRMTDEPGGNIIPVHCRGVRPLVLNDLYTWGQWDVASALGDCGILTDDEVEFVAASASAAMLFAAIEEAGYDCVLYTNVCESMETAEESLMVWRAALVKGEHSVSFERDDPRILSQLDPTDEDWQWHRSLEREIDSCREELRSMRSAAIIPA
jgi:hypothetical protein